MEQRKSRVINSHEFLKYLWKQKIFVILIIVICMILMCVYYGFSHRTSIEGIGISSDAEYEKTYNELSENEKVNLDLALKDYELYENSWSILQNSILMKIDAYNAKQVNLQYMVSVSGNSGDTSQYINQIIPQYVQYALNGSLGADVAEKLGYDSAQIIELIDASYNTYSYGCGVFTIFVFGTEYVDGLSEAVQAAIEEFDAAPAGPDGQVILTLLDVDTVNTHSTKIFDRQKLYENDRPQIKARLNTAVSALTKKAFDCYQYKTSLNRDESYTEGTVNNISAGINIKGLIKYAAAGFILGLILTIVIALIKFQFARKIIAETDYSQTMGLKIITKVAKTDQEDFMIASEKLTAYCGKNQINKLAVLTCSEQLKEMLQDKDQDQPLSRNLAENGIELVFVPDVCKNSKSMMTLFETGHAVLMEKRNDSEYYDVYDEVILCRENEVRIAGVIDVL